MGISVDNGDCDSYKVASSIRLNKRLVHGPHQVYSVSIPNSAPPLSVLLGLENGVSIVLVINKLGDFDTLSPLAHNTLNKGPVSTLH